MKLIEHVMVSVLSKRSLEFVDLAKLLFNASPLLQ